MRTPAALLALLGLAGGPAAAADPPRRPNIVFIVADDMGYADCGVHGCKDVPTPNLDALANGGVRFTDGYVTGAVCSPTRAGLMTGRYHHRDGVHDWIRPGAAAGLKKGVPTVADYLQKAGYHTGLVGKWHLGEKDDYHPLARGFKDFFGFLGGGRNYFTEGDQTKLRPYVRLVRGREPVNETEYATHAFGREAVDFIARRNGKGEPFFLYLAFNAVHTPMQAPADYLKRFPAIKDAKRRTYAGMLAAMDDDIGKVLRAIKDGGYDDNTLVCFISDNGGPITRNAPNSSRNTPLRGGKGETWEGGIRVPFFMKWNGQLKAGSTFTRPAIQMDLVATCLALAGVEADAKYPLDGVNLMPYLTGDKKSPHDTLCWVYDRQGAIRQGDWKLTFVNAPVQGMGPVTGLFDLAKDVGETSDLAAAHPDRVKKMQDAWLAWRKAVFGDQPIPEADAKDVNNSP